MRGVRLPTVRSTTAELERRIFDLERKLRTRLSDTRPEEDAEIIVFNQGGDTTAVSTTEVSGRYYPIRKGRLVYLVASLTTAGSSTTTVSIKKNGVELTTISLVSSDTIESKTVSSAFSLGADYLTVAATAAGTGAEGLTVQAKFV